MFDGNVSRDASPIIRPHDREVSLETSPKNNMIQDRVNSESTNQQIQTYFRVSTCQKVMTVSVLEVYLWTFERIWVIFYHRGYAESFKLLTQSPEPDSIYFAFVTEDLQVTLLLTLSY